MTDVTEDSNPATEKPKKKQSVDAKIRSRLVAKIGRTLWQLENKDSIKGVAIDARKERWKAEKQSYVAKARELVRRLPKAGVGLSLVETAKDDADALGDDD